MLDRLRGMLSTSKADYTDIRYEQMHTTNVVVSNDTIETANSSDTDGYVVRCLTDGGMANAVFTSPDQSKWAIAKASENSSLFSRYNRKKIQFQSTPIIQDEVLFQVDTSPLRVSLADKMELLKKYNSIAMVHPSIQNITLTYFEVMRDKYFCSSEGTQIHQKMITFGFRGNIMAKDHRTVQNVRVGYGSIGDFQQLLARDEMIEHKTKVAIDLLDAEPVKAGKYKVLLNQSMGGVFVHEAFGHFSEADLIQNNPTFRDKLALGNKIGTDALTIIADSSQPNSIGFYRYDDEGIATRPTTLLKNGVIHSRLHSRSTASEFQEPLTGHAVSEDYRFAPIIRMGNIFIPNGKHTVDELMQLVGDGLYLLDGKGGQTSGDNFTFGAQYGYLIKNGKKDRMIREINMSGNLFHTLNNIQHIGNDLLLSSIGGCGKGQINIKSCYGTPHLVIDEINMGGI